MKIFVIAIQKTSHHFYPRARYHRFHSYFFNSNFFLSIFFQARRGKSHVRNRGGRAALTPAPRPALLAIPTETGPTVPGSSEELNPFEVKRYSDRDAT